MKIIKIKIILILFPLFIFTVLASTLLAAERIELPEELRQFDIQNKFIKIPLEDVGAIKKLTGKGKTVVVHRAREEAYYGSERDPVYENDSIYTLADSRCRLEFKDKNVVTMASDTHLDIDEVYASILKGEKRSVFGMMKGKAIFYAIRLFRYPEMKFQLKTSTAAIGVRGTKFGAEIETVKEGASSILDRMFASRNLEFAQIEKGTQNIITRIYVFEGEIDVTSLIDGRVQRLHKNEILEADLRGLGEVKFDPGRTKSFRENVTSGMESAPGLEPPKIDGRRHEEELDRMEKMIDTQQKVITPNIEHDLHPRGGGPPAGGGGHQ